MACLDRSWRADLAWFHVVERFDQLVDADRLGHVVLHAPGQTVLAVTLQLRITAIVSESWDEWPSSMEALASYWRFEPGQQKILVRYYSVRAGRVIAASGEDISTPAATTKDRNGEQGATSEAGRLCEFAGSIPASSHDP